MASKALEAGANPFQRKKEPRSGSIRSPSHIRQRQTADLLVFTSLRERAVKAEGLLADA